MGRHLYGPQELQQRLRVSRQRVRQLIDRPDFPEPYDRLAMGSVWRIVDVEAWIKKHRPYLNDDD
jgi:predicted DNA-binding transcriptional regulator AlpA